MLVGLEIYQGVAVSWDPVTQYGGGRLSEPSPAPA